MRIPSATQHPNAIVENPAGTQWSSRIDAASAHANAVRFAATSYRGAMNCPLRTWATAMTTPQANVIESSRLTNYGPPTIRSIWLCETEWYVGRALA